MSLDSQAPPEDSAPATGSVPQYTPRHRLHYDVEQDDIVLNIHHLENIFIKIQQEKKIPTLDNAIPWIGLFLGFLLALLPNDFKEFAYIEGSVWSGLFFFLALASGIKMLAVLRDVWNSRHEKPRTARELAEEVMKDFQDRREQRDDQQRLVNLGTEGNEPARSPAAATQQSSPDKASSRPEPTS